MATKLAAGLDRPSHSEAANTELSPRHKGRRHSRVTGPAHSSPGLPCGSTPLPGFRSVRTRPPSFPTSARRRGRPSPQRPLSALASQPSTLSARYHLEQRGTHSLWCTDEPSGV